MSRKKKEGPNLGKTKYDTDQTFANFINSPKFHNFAKISKCRPNCENQLKLWKLTEIVNIGWNCANQSKLWQSVEIVKIEWNCETFEIVKPLKLWKWITQWSEADICLGHLPKLTSSRLTQAHWAYLKAILSWILLFKSSRLSGKTNRLINKDLSL